MLHRLPISAEIITLMNKRLHAYLFSYHDLKTSTKPNISLWDCELKTSWEFLFFLWVYLKSKIIRIRQIPYLKQYVTTTKWAFQGPQNAFLPILLFFPIDIKQKIQNFRIAIENSWWTLHFILERFLFGTIIWKD